MNGTMKRTSYDSYFKSYEAPKAYEVYKESAEEKLVSETCHTSAFSLAAMAGGILMCVGIVVYALITM